jgi:O-antigen/teichoic acid export membrane protein
LDNNRQFSHDSISAFSALEGAKDRQRVGNLLARSIKYIFITTGPIVVFTVVYAEEILQVWLGDEFASESAVVMQILALGVLINSLAHTPYALLQGTAGRIFQPSFT